MSRSDCFIADAIESLNEIHDENLDALRIENSVLHIENGGLVSDNCHLKDELLALYRRLDAMKSGGAS